MSLGVGGWVRRGSGVYFLERRVLRTSFFT